MALKLDTESRGEILKQEAAIRTKRNFKIAKIGIAAVLLLIAGFNIAGMVGNINKASKVSAQNDELNARLTTMQSEVAAYKASQQSASQNETATDTDVTVSANTIDKEMYSAQEAGERVCELQMLNFRNELLLESDKQDLMRLIGSVSLWYGHQMNPDKSPIKWEFLTGYDHSEYVYDVVWGCYTADGKYNDNYLLCVVFGTYNGESDTFTITGTYRTDFGSMYEVYGDIEVGTSSTENQVGEDVEDMIDDLTGEDLFDLPDDDNDEETSEEDTSEEDTSEEEGPAADDVPEA